jgi:hypothetical protein
MTGTDGQVPGEPADGPLSLEMSLEVLADLHAGVLEEPLATQLRRRIAGDPRASTVLTALDATVADLAALRQQYAVRMPDDVVLQLDAALAAEVRRNGRNAAFPASPPEVTQGALTGRAPGVPELPPAPTTDFAARRRRGGGWVGAGLVAVAAAVLGVVALSGVPWETAGTPKATDAFGTATGVHPAQPLALTRGTLGNALDQARNSHNFGPLSAPAKLRHCLAANGVGEGREPIGALEVTLDGRPGILLVLTTGQLAEFRLLVVGPDCGPGNPSQLANSTVRGR